MEIEGLVKSVKAAKLEKFQLTEIVYKPLLKGFGYPIDDGYKMVDEYVFNKYSKVVADYVYMVDAEPAIAIFLEDDVDDDKIGSRMGVIAKSVDVKFILTISGVEGILYYRGELEGDFHPVNTKFFTGEVLKGCYDLSPKYILSRDESYWEDIIDRNLFKLIDNDKLKYKGQFFDVLNKAFPNQIDDRNIDNILKILVGDKVVSDVKGSNEDEGKFSKLLSEIKYDTDLRYTRISGVMIGDEDFPPMTYLDFMRELVKYMRRFVNDSNIHKISKAGLHNDTCQMKSDLYELSPSYRGSHMILGNTYIGMSSSGSRIINTVKRLFDILEIDQSTVLLEWVDERYISSTIENVSGDDKKVILSEITDVDIDRLTSKAVLKAYVKGVEIKETSYRNILRQVINTIDFDYSENYVDNILLNTDISVLQIESNLKRLNVGNKRAYTKLGEYYVGLHYDIKGIITGLISLCEAFDVNQDDIIMYLE